MGNACRKTAIDVIPDKAVMLQVVDTIVALEEMLKRGDKMTPAQQKEWKAVKKVSSGMTKLQKPTETS